MKKYWEGIENTVLIFKNRRFAAMSRKSHSSIIVPNSECWKPEKVEIRKSPDENLEMDHICSKLKGIEYKKIMKTVYVWFDC